MDWTVAKSGIFNCTETWEAITSKHPIVDWQMVQHSSTTARHSFISWLALRNRQTTHDRLKLFGIKVTSCVYFIEGIEKAGVA